MRHRPNRRQLLSTTLALAAFAAGPAWAQPKSVRLVVGSPPGGPSDFLARLMADAQGAATGTSFVVDNRPGASGTVATEAVARAPADGATLLIGGPGSTVVAPYIFPKLGYDPAKDLLPVAVLGAGAFVLAVHPSVPAQTLKDFVALLKTKPDTLSYGSGGNGSSGQLCTETFAQAVGGRAVHVPYKGDGQALNDLLGGQIQFMFTAPNVAIPHGKSGRLRLLAVTSRERITALPDVPSVHEAALKDFEYLGWIMTFVPAATPRATIAALQADWARARSQPSVRNKLDELGMLPPEHLTDSKALEAFLASERVRTANVVKAAGIKLN